MSDFAVSNGNVKSAAIACIISVIVVVVLPLIIIYSVDYLLTAIVNNSEASFDGIDSLKERAMSFYTMYLLLGIPLIALNVVGKFYPEGNYARLTFLSMASVYSAIWLYLIFGGGEISMDVTSLANSVSGTQENAVFKNIDITLVMAGLLKIMMFLALFKIIVPISEYFGARKKYLEGGNNSK